MKRALPDGKNKKTNKESIKNMRCPNCHHDRMWTSRGIMGAYKFKCTRCGWLIK